jgi:inner membrane protein
VVTLAAGPYASLALRRGLTHGVAGLLVLPFVVAGAVLLWDRWIRRRRDPDRAPARPGAILGLAVLGVWSHPLLDWLNTYGMRWLLPFDGAWSYGDSVFIVDPWLWLLLGGATFLAFSESARARILWGALALLLSLPVLLVEGLPGWSRALWLLGLAGIVLLRWRTAAPARGAASRGAASHGAAAHGAAARLLLGVAVLYIAGMVAQTSAAERIALEEAEARGLGPVTALMVGPIPVEPLARHVIVETADSYWTGSFRWTTTPRVSWDEEVLPRVSGDPGLIGIAEGHPEAARYLVWARFPLWEVRSDPDGKGHRVRIRDVRYLDREAGGLGGIEVRISAELELLEAGPLERK